MQSREIHFFMLQRIGSPRWRLWKTCWRVSKNVFLYRWPSYCHSWWRRDGGVCLYILDKGTNNFTFQVLITKNALLIIPFILILSTNYIISLPFTHSKPPHILLFALFRVQDFDFSLLLHIYTCVYTHMHALQNL